MLTTLWKPAQPVSPAEKSVLEATASKAFIPSPSTSLTGLPPEIKRMILENMQDFSSLRNLVRASPEYHAVYIAAGHYPDYNVARNAIFTRVTFSDLLNRGMDISKMGPVTDVCVKSLGEPSSELKNLLRKIFAHYTGLEKLETSHGKVVLDIRQCKLLLSMFDIVPWKGTIAYDKKSYTKLDYKPPVADPALYPPGYRTYHVCYLGEVRDGHEQALISKTTPWAVLEAFHATGLNPFDWTLIDFCVY